MVFPFPGKTRPQKLENPGKTRGQASSFPFRHYPSSPVVPFPWPSARQRTQPPGEILFELADEGVGRQRAAVIGLSADGRQQVGVLGTLQQFAPEGIVAVALPPGGEIEQAGCVG